LEILNGLSYNDPERWLSGIVQGYPSSLLANPHAHHSENKVSHFRVQHARGPCLLFGDTVKSRYNEDRYNEFSIQRTKFIFLFGPP
jgi:hypothetical protein